MNRLIIICLGVIASFPYASADWAPMAKVNIDVVDEQHRPVGSAQITVSAFGGGQAQILQTDQDGRVVARLRSHGSVGGSVSKEGFYTSGYRFSLLDHVPKGVTVGRRYPDVTHRVVIRPKLKPAPMYAYRFSRSIPVEGEEIGIDLLKADWVAPHGKGEVADVMVKIVSYDPAGRGGGELHWRFPGAHNGLVPIAKEQLAWDSDYRMPRHAPASGYISDWTYKAYWKGQDIASEFAPDGIPLGRQPYFLRIRSRASDEGKFVGALYGRIDYMQGSSSASIYWSARAAKTAPFVSFTYHVNPDGTRNLEFDPERNLFTDPPWDRNNFPRQP
jgi:hypothetical protein